MVSIRFPIFKNYFLSFQDIFDCFNSVVPIKVYIIIIVILYLYQSMNIKIIRSFNSSNNLQQKWKRSSYKYQKVE